MVENITFGQLRKIMLERAGDPEMPSTSSLANVLSALSGFLKERGLSPNTQVGSTLRGGYTQARDAHLAQLRINGRPDAYVRNRGSHLTSWHQLVRRLDHDSAALDGTETPLHRAIRALFANGRKVATTAKAIGLPRETLISWIKGGTPRRGNEEYLRRLETVCKLEPGALTSLLPYRARIHAEEEKPKVAWRELLASLLRDQYRLKAREASESLRTEWRGYLAYKTSTGSNASVQSDAGSGGGARFRQALAVDDATMEKQWRLKPARPEMLGNDRWVDIIAGSVCRTAAMKFGYLASYLGWARLPTERSGAGLSEAGFTLGMYTDTKLIEAFLEWRSERSGINGGVISFLNDALMICHPQTGFLTTRPDIGKRMGFKDPETWHEHVRRAHETLNSMKRKVKKFVTYSRDPKDPLKQSLDLAAPIENFVKGVQRLEASSLSRRKLSEAVRARDLLLMALALSNPLRLTNLMELSYRADNSGDLRKTPTGWRIYIPRERFKNADNGAAKDRDYDRAVSPAVWPYIERYLKTYRAKLGGSRPELVFVSSEMPDRPWDGLSDRFRELTKFVPGCPGVGLQAVRHIVATSIILRTKGNYDLAARTLHDRADTVRKYYAHLFPSSTDRGLEEVFGDILAQMHKPEIATWSISDASVAPRADVA